MESNSTAPDLLLFNKSIKCTNITLNISKSDTELHILSHKNDEVYFKKEAIIFTNFVLCFLSQLLSPSLAIFSQPSRPEGEIISQAYDRCAQSHVVKNELCLPLHSHTPPPLPIHCQWNWLWLKIYFILTNESSDCPKIT